MDRETAITKLRQMAERNPLTDTKAPALGDDGPADEPIGETFAQVAERMRLRVDKLAASMGVELKEDSLAMPVPIDLLEAIVVRLNSLSDANPPVEFLPPHEA